MKKSQNSPPGENPDEDAELAKFVNAFVGPRLSIFQMTAKERKAIMVANPPSIDLIHASAYLNWGWKACGFGQLSFTFDKETGAITCSNECMSRENVKIILRAMADHIADNAILDS